MPMLGAADTTAFNFPDIGFEGVAGQFYSGGQRVDPALVQEAMSKGFTTSSQIQNYVDQETQKREKAEEERIAQEAKAQQAKETPSDKFEEERRKREEQTGADFSNIQRQAYDKGTAADRGYDAGWLRFSPSKGGASVKGERLRGGI